MVDTKKLWIAFGWGVASAVSFPIGCLVSFLFPINKTFNAALLAFGIGALLFALAFELFIEPIYEGQDKITLTILTAGAIVGAAIFELTNYLLDNRGAFLRNFNLRKEYLRDLLKSATKKVDQQLTMEEQKQLKEQIRILYKKSHRRHRPLVSLGRKKRTNFVKDPLLKDSREKINPDTLWKYKSADWLSYPQSSSGLSTSDLRSSVGGTPSPLNQSKEDSLHYSPHLDNSNGKNNRRAALSKTTHSISNSGPLTPEEEEEYCESLGFENPAAPVLLEADEDGTLRLVKKVQWKLGENPEADHLYLNRSIDGLPNLPPPPPSSSERKIRFKEDEMNTKESKVGFEENGEKKEKYAKKEGRGGLRMASTNIEYKALKDSQANLLTDSDGAVGPQQLQDYQQLPDPISDSEDLHQTRHHGPTSLEIANSLGAEIEEKYVGIVIWLGLLIDSIPESIVIGLLTLKEKGISYSFIFGVVLSNFPEALSSSVIMMDEKFRKITIFSMWVAVMLSTGGGALIGAAAFDRNLSTTQDYIAHGLKGMAGGAMLVMISRTGLPEAFHQAGKIVGFSTLLGFLSAFVFTYALQDI